jgi:hypothetical protein
MHLMNLNMLYDFMQVLNIKRKHPTKNEYFPKHLIFTTIYFMQVEKLNRNKYYGKEINMNNFVQTTEHDVHMYAKFGGLTVYEFL